MYQYHQSHSSMNSKGVFFFSTREDCSSIIPCTPSALHHNIFPTLRCVVCHNTSVSSIRESIVGGVVYLVAIRVTIPPQHREKYRTTRTLLEDKNLDVCIIILLVTMLCICYMLDLVFFVLFELS